MYDDIVDALVGACGLDKMDNASMQHRARHAGAAAAGGGNGASGVGRVTSELARVAGGGTPCADALGRLLAAAEVLAAAVAALGLENAHTMAPLLTGDKLKLVLTNIPKGAAFGEIMQEQTRWMLCHPDGTVDGIAEYLREQHPDFS